MGMLKAHIIPVTIAQQNCTILFDEDSKKGILLDPGGDLPYIMQAIEQEGITIEAIWLTHGHFDHVGAAMDAKEALGVEIIGPQKDDEFLLGMVEETAKAYNITDKIRNCTTDRWLEEGDELDCAGHKFKVYHTPGHAPGHVIFYNEELRFALMGDVLFHGSIGRTDLPRANHQQLLDSIKNKVLPLGDDVGFLCGHGPGSTIGTEKRSNPFVAPIA